MLAEITHKATGHCQGYGGSLHTTDLAQRAAGCGIEGRVVDGNDVLAVHPVAKYAVEKAWAGAGRARA